MSSPRTSHASHPLKAMRLVLLAALAACLAPSSLWAVGDASTDFQLFVPPNNDTTARDVAIIVTNCSPFSTTVDLIDDGADGDTDDSNLGFTLARGQSYVRYIKDGAVNDDAGGKWDGDYFRVKSTEPVVLQMATKSDWQWDFVPAENKTMRGQSFFIYSPSTSFSQRDVNLVAYEDDTEVFVLDITTTPLNATGLTSVNLAAPKEVLKATLNAGEDLIGRKNLGIDILDPGRTYWIRASKGVTCQYGSLVTNARDGGGFVPSENGFASGERFYFYIPRDFADEREVRIVSFSDANTVTFSGWNNAERRWQTISTYPLDRFDHADWVESGTDFPMYRLECTPGKKVSVFAASWLEAKGLSGTKDIASFASSESGYGAGKEFLVYVPQPGTQGNVRFNGQRIGNNGHLFIHAHVNGTTYSVVDADTQGRLFSRSGTLNKDGFVNVRMSEAEFAALNKPAQGLRPYLKVEANHLITVMVTNFNDNWMTFAPSVVLPNPILTASATVDQATVGQEGCITFTASNAGAGALSNTIVEVPLDPAVTYRSSTLSIPNLGEPQIEVDPTTGVQLLTWENFTIPAGGRLEGTICFQVNPRRRPANAVVRNRDFLSFPVLVRGIGFGVPVEQGGEAEGFTAQTAVVLTVNDASQTNVFGLAATPSGTQINVTWQTGREPDLQGFRVYRSTSGDGPFTLLTTTLIPGTGDAVTGARYTSVDRPSPLSALYYYRLEVLTQAGSSFYGPVAVLAEDRTPPPAPVITRATPSDGSVEAEITGGNQDGDLRGYQLYRADSLNGNYVRLNALLINPGALATDATAANGTTYFYKARAADTSGNTSEFSAAVSVTMPSSITKAFTLAYEDQLGPGKNDWDYNDWVVTQESTETFRNGGVAGVTVEFESLARGANLTNGFNFRMKAAGDWSATVGVFADRNATTPLEERVVSGSGAVDVVIFADTKEALPPSLPGNFTNTLNRHNPAVLGRVARISITLDPAANLSGNRQRPPFDPYLRGDLGEVHQVGAGFPNSTEVVTFWPESPLLGFNLDYVLVVPGTQWRWPLENQKIWDAYPTQFATFMLSGKNRDQTWYEAANRNSGKTYNWFPFAETKSAADFLVAAAKDTDAPTPWQDFASPFVAAPKAVVFDTTEFRPNTLLFASANGGVHLVDETGAAQSGWPVDANSFRATPAVGRLFAGDANAAMITAEERYDGAARVVAWELTPAPILRWQFEAGAAIKSPPVIADLEGDGEAEVLAITTAGQLHVLRADGTRHPRSPIALGASAWNDKNILVGGAPIVVDVNGDGRAEIFAATPSGTRVVGLTPALEPLLGWPKDVPAAIVGGLALTRDAASGQASIAATLVDGTVLAWDVFGRVRTGFPVAVEAPVTAPTVAFRDGITGIDTLVVVGAAGRVRLLGSDGSTLRGWPQELGSDVLASPVVGDLDGDAEPEILVAGTNGRVAAWKFDGTPVEAFTRQVPGAIQASPLLTDLDGDARLEATFATALGEVYRFEGEGQSPLPPDLAMNWASATGSEASNAPLAWLRFDAAPLPALTRSEVAHAVTGQTVPGTEGSLKDLNLDGILDAADIPRASE